MRQIELSFVALIGLLVLVSPATFQAADTDKPFRSYDLANGAHTRLLQGGMVDVGKARSDTVYLMGGDADPNYGDFEDADGSPSWDDWTSIDMTAGTDTLWTVSDYNCANLDPATEPNHAWWCGEGFEFDCGSGDYAGYGNSYREQLEWRGTVPDNTLGTTVTIQAVLNYDNEPYYDYLYLLYENTTGMQQLQEFNGQADSVVVSQSFQLTPADYVGAGADEVHLRWLFESDGAWSDQDCLWPTQGAAQIDLIAVTFDQGTGPILQGTVEDCDDHPLQWYVEIVTGVGNFAHIWPLLEDIDPCHENNTPVLGFIDDGEVVPGTGGYQCITWCYGPGGYIVNPEGGLLGPDFHIWVEVWSPALAWPGDAYDGADFGFDVYRHESLSFSSPGIFYIWHVRSTTDPTGETWDRDWGDRSFVYYGGPEWFRQEHTVSDLLVPGRRLVQAALGVYELGYVWGWVLTDGTPAPYFDNVMIRAYQFDGPVVTAREIHLAQDNFPAIGTFDYGDPVANSVRFDMARNISPSDHQRNDPGDSIIVDVVPVRTGSVLNDLPKLFYKLFPNPVFDAVRTYPAAGFVYGDTTYIATGAVIHDRYNFDLPDTGFFFPGDVLHYYIVGEDNVNGDVGVTRLPADTTGFSHTPYYIPMLYPSSFVVRALPSFSTLSSGEHPQILWWNDYGGRGNENEWYYALYNNGYQEGLDFDLYYTNGPSSGVGNGLGGRATATHLMGYDAILYGCGDLIALTLSNGDFQIDPSDDLQVLDTWLRQGEKNMFLTGDDLVYDLVQNAGAAGGAFVNNWIGVALVDRDVRPFIANQSAPTVQPISGNSVFMGQLDRWIAYGGCPRLNTFDAVQIAASTEQLAEFLDPNGSGGQYFYAAATLHHDTTYNDDIIYLPYDLASVRTVPGGYPGGLLAARSLLLHDVLLYFGHIGLSPTVPVPEARAFTVHNYPNPFNPSTKIEYYLPVRDELTIKIYDLRGELVRVLVDELREAGPGFVIWDGSDGRGRAVASGIYFYETRTQGQTRISKMALVK